MITAYGYRAYVRPSRIYDRVGGVADAEPAADGATRRRQASDVVDPRLEQIERADDDEARSDHGRIPLRRRDRDFLRHQGHLLS